MIYAPPMSTALRWFVGLQFVLLLSGAAVFLWHADQSPLATNVVGFGVLLTAQWALCAAMQGRISPWMTLMLQSGVLATATAALGLREWHWLFKPATMLCALAYIAASHRAALARAHQPPHRSIALLLAAIAFSLGGDVFLMLDGHAPFSLFIPGLVSFLLAHVCYVVLFREDARWLSHRPSLLLIVAISASMYAALWNLGLPAALRLPVAAYVCVIALMAAQAWSRYLQQRTRAALLVALGASLFLLSDSLLSINRFVQPLPWSAIWVLSSYFLAQALMVQGMVSELCTPAAQTPAGPSHSSVP